MKNFVKAKEIKTLPDFEIWIKFDDMTEGKVSLSEISGKGVFKIWDDYQNFQNAKITHNDRVISWGDEIDICVDSLYEKINKKNY